MADQNVNQCFAWLTPVQSLNSEVIMSTIIKNTMTLTIKNMVCNRCIMVIQNELDKENTVTKETKDIKP